MKLSTTVPNRGRQSKEEFNQHMIQELVDAGADSVAAEQLVKRISAGCDTSDKFQYKAINSFVGQIKLISSSGGRLTSVH